MTKSTARAEHALVQKLAAYFKVSKKELLEFKSYIPVEGEEDKNTPIVVFNDIPSLDELGVDISEVFYCVELTTKLNLLELLDKDKFLKSEIYEAFHNGLGYLTNQYDKESYRLIVMLKGTVWILYNCNFLDDIDSGIVLPFTGTDNQIVMTPIKQYLEVFHPHD